MSFFISSAHAQSSAASGEGSLFSLIFMVSLFVIFYFIVIRPQKKRQKEHKDMVSNIGKGDEVVTTSGMLGKVNKLDEDYVVLQVTDNVELKFQKGSIHAILPKGTLKKI